MSTFNYYESWVPKEPKKTIDEIIDQVLVENNTHLNKEQVEYSISESRMVITRHDVYEIIKRIPIQIYGSNIHAEITDEGIIIKENISDER